VAAEKEFVPVKTGPEADKALWEMCTDQGALGGHTSVVLGRLFDDSSSLFDVWLNNSGSSDVGIPDRAEKALKNGGEVPGADSSADATICNGIMNGSRWCDNRDGTVTDMTTGLVWLQNANCWGLISWKRAITKPITDLRDGICGLSDNSAWGDWHLPTLDELYTLSYGAEAVTHETPYAFSDVQSDFYWSATTHAYYSNYSWYVYFKDGSVNYYSKIDHNYLWPVRDGR